MPQIKPIDLLTEAFYIRNQVIWRKAVILLGIEKYKRKKKQSRKKNAISPL